MSHWMHPEDVRTPVTVAEGEAALDMIDTSADRLEAVIARKEQSDGAQPGLRALLSSWQAKRAEVAYALERLDAGELPLSIEVAALRARIDKLVAENQELKSAAGSARAYVDSVKSSRRERLGENAELKRQHADLIAKNARLTAALREAHEARERVAPDEVKRALKKSHHDALAFTAEVLDEMVANGVVLSSLARLCLDECNDSLPRGYRITWRAKDYLRKRDAADARAESLAS